MAASDTLISTGIGLQATLDATARVFAKRQNEEIARKKLKAQQEAADQEALNKALSDYDLDPTKYHRLVQGDVIAVTNDAINKIIDLKESGDPNWRNRVQREIASEWKNNIAHLSGLSTQYTAFEKGFTTLGAYQTKDQQALKILFDESTDYLQLSEKAKNAGLSSFDPETGLITQNTFFPRIDLGNELDRDFGKVDPVEVSTSTEYVSGKPVQVIKTKVPNTIKEAEQYAVDGYIPASLESVATSRLNDPVFRFQYADSRGIDINDDAALIQSMMSEGAEYASAAIKRRSLGSTVEVKIGLGEKESAGGLAKEMTTITSGVSDVTGQPIDIQSFRNIGVNYPNYTVSNQKNLTDFMGRRVEGGTISDTRVVETRVMPYELFKEGGTTYFRPVQKGKEFGAEGGKASIAGMMPFVVFGQPGAYYYLPAVNFSFADLQKGGEAISSTVISSIDKMKSNSTAANAAIREARKDPNSALSKAMASKDADAIYNAYYDIYNKIENQ